MRSNSTWRTRKSFWIHLLPRLFPSRPKKVVWGWKEPNTHMIANELLELQSEMKYIHVLRNGLDMAYSKNRQQLYNWGREFEIDVTTKEEEKLKQLQLELWVRSTKRIMKLQERFPDRVYLLNLSALCRLPEKEIPNLCNFMGVSINQSELNELVKIPQFTNSHHRYKTLGLAPFSQDQIDFVREMGFETNMEL